MENATYLKNVIIGNTTIACVKIMDDQILIAEDTNIKFEVLNEESKESSVDWYKTNLSYVDATKEEFEFMYNEAMKEIAALKDV